MKPVLRPTNPTCTRESFSTHIPRAQILRTSMNRTLPLAPFALAASVAASVSAHAAEAPPTLSIDSSAAANESSSRWQPPALQLATRIGDPVTAPAQSTNKPLQLGSYFRPARSNSTTPDPDPPKYVVNASRTWLAHLTGQYRPDSLSWLDIGLDYRFRYEYRENDIRSASADLRPHGFGLDTPILHRTRFYLGVKEIVDPFRFAIEIQDSRISRARERRPVPQADEINTFQPIRLYAELHFENLLRDDPHGNARPVSLRYGIHNFEFLDRRLIANNQWRNTANTFQGFHGIIGQESNDWQLDFLAVQPLTRLKYDWDRPIDPKYLYGVIGNWRGWSEFITIQPYYLQLRQSRYVDSAGKGQVERVVHTPGLRLYGVVGKSGLDFDFDVMPQFGNKQPLAPGPGVSSVASKRETRTAERIRAFAATAELGYTYEKHDWKPRLSVFYGFASGDRYANTTLTPSSMNGKAPSFDTTDNRFERLYGFQRPWSANDYIVFENISTPKVQLAFRPSKDLRVELGYSWFYLASGSDRYYRANAGTGTSRDYTEKAGKNIGQEFDTRIRYPLTKTTDLTLGYAHFQAGDYIKQNVFRTAATSGVKSDKTSSDFAYIEISQRFF